jgi:nitroreductase
MSESFGEQDIRVLDRILETRRSVRSFKGDAPSDSMIRAVAHAGVYAPYAALAVGDTLDFRRFFVFRKGSKNLSFVNEIIKRAARTSLEQLDKEIQSKPFLREKSAKYIQRLSSVSLNGLPGITDAPCFIVAAERRGVPSVEKQSLAHVMQNMWLKATALGLGFQLVSVIESLTENQEFSKLLALPFGEFAFNGCIVGYAAQEQAARKAISEDRAITWL